MCLLTTEISIGDKQRFNALKNGGAPTDRIHILLLLASALSSYSPHSKRASADRHQLNSVHGLHPFN